MTRTPRVDLFNKGLLCRGLCSHTHTPSSEPSQHSSLNWHVRKQPWGDIGSRNWGTHAEYVRVRLVGSGLGSSPGWGGFLSRSHTRLPSLRKGKESCRGVLGDVSGSDGSAAGEASGSDISTAQRVWWLFCFFFFRSVWCRVRKAPPVMLTEKLERRARPPAWRPWVSETRSSVMQHSPGIKEPQEERREEEIQQPRPRLCPSFPVAQQ